MMDKLPPNWSLVKLGDVGEIIAGGTPSTKVKEYFNGDIAWITPADLTGYKNKFISNGKRNISEKGLKNSSARLIPKGSILFSSRAPIGYVAIAANELTTNQGFKSFVPSKNVFNEYVFYYLKNAKNLAERFASGTTFKEISASNFANLPIPLTSLPEQKKIVGKIEELFSGLEGGIAELKKVKQQIKVYRQAVLASAFSGRLVQQEVGGRKLEVSKAAEPVVEYGNGNLPEGWEEVKLNDVCEKIVGGGTPSTKVEKYWNGNIDWITSADIYGIRDIRPRKKVTKEAIKNSAANLVPKSTIIVVTRVSLGRLAIADREICFSQDSQGLILNKKMVDDNYVLWFLSSATQIFKYKNRGTTIKGVTKKQLADLEFILPPKAQQLQIVEEIEKRFSEADNLEKAVDEGLAKAESLRQSILKQAFEGKLIK